MEVLLKNWEAVDPDCRSIISILQILERVGVFFIGHVGGVDTWLGLLFSLIWLWRCYSMRLPVSLLDNSVEEVSLDHFYTVSNVFHDLQTFTMRCLQEISM
jgi:hypothetical protein